MCVEKRRPRRGNEDAEITIACDEQQHYRVGEIEGEIPLQEAKAVSGKLGRNIESDDRC